MLKWFFECRSCGYSTTQKTSGSIYPKDYEEERPKNVKCFDCGHGMICDGVGDSSQF